MILQNFWAWRKQTQVKAVSSALDVSGITDMTGTAVVKIYSSSSSGSAIALNRTLCVDDDASLGIVFGSGDTAPTATDYALDTDESASLTITKTISQNYASNKIEIIFACSVTNTSANAIELKEVGIKKRISTTNATTYVDMLFAREILSSPITIAAGETKTFNYTWTMQ